MNGHWMLWGVLAVAGCSGPKGDDLTDRPGIGDDDDDDVTTDTDTDTGTTDPDGLLDALGNSAWHGETTRDGVVRRIQHEFRGSEARWAEIVNPWGPARDRRMRDMVIHGDGSVTTTITRPAGYAPDADEGLEESWTISIDEGPPRQLVIEGPDGTERFDEGPEPQPTEGLTASVRVFAPAGNVDAAFCDSGLFGFDYPVLFDFARGQGGEAPIATDEVAGIQLAQWVDPGDNEFAVADVPGLDVRGGTDLDDRYNFVVSYRGTIDHPGGFLAFREANDQVTDGVWIFLASDVGTGGEDEMFLAVHGFAWSDGTPDEPFMDLGAGTYDVEIILARCTETIDEPTTVQFSVANGPWTGAPQLPSTPWLDPGLFPPAF